MEARHQTLDQAIVSRYTGQPARLPAELRRRIESAWNDRPVEIYAFADLGPTLRLAASWVAPGPPDLALGGGARRWGGGGPPPLPARAPRPGGGAPGTLAQAAAVPARPGRAAARHRAV